jgi:hypothetical protein
MTPRASNDNDPCCTKRPAKFIAEILELTALWSSTRRPRPPKPRKKPALRLV